MESIHVSKNCILSAEAIKRKLRRMAFQIAEANADEDSIIIAGIAGNGNILAQKIVEELKHIVNMSIELTVIQLTKKNPVDAQIQDQIDLTDKIIIVVDDVSNTGRTLLYALRPLLSFLPKKIQTLVLVERSHKLFAVQPDYVGLSI
ncbi:MAG TPA: phosphoribosyltransferase family protein, partial [Chitinophagaceae bacterium]|nr:phosphoribosyltransferase family protein [Chitinophagaceae bacterium]